MTFLVKYLFDKLCESCDVIDDAIIGPAGEEHVLHITTSAAILTKQKFSPNNILLFLLLAEQRKSNNQMQCKGNFDVKSTCCTQRQVAPS
jgi:hypothetical protein